MAGVIETVVFDLGGVLIDWNPRYLYRKIFDDESEMEYFLTKIATMEWHLEQDRGRTMKEATEILAAKYPEHDAEIRAFYDRWPEMFDGPIHGTVEILRELRDLGYPLHALTNYSAEAFVLARRDYDFLEWFDQIIVSGEEGMIKPDRELYAVLIARTGLDPATTVFIDDSIPNVAAARELGFTGVAFDNAELLREELTKLDLLNEPTERMTSDA
ncbi:MAG: HAD family phosphatase [Actinomycetota bacterium]|nr:HAD family phosphatase [Actinomycetota bacterium]